MSAGKDHASDESTGVEDEYFLSESIDMEDEGEDAWAIRGGSSPYF